VVNGAMGRAFISLLTALGKKITSGKGHVKKNGACVDLEATHKKNLGVNSHR